MRSRSDAGLARGRHKTPLLTQRMHAEERRGWLAGAGGQDAERGRYRCARRRRHGRGTSHAAAAHGGASGGWWAEGGEHGGRDMLRQAVQVAMRA